MIRQFLLKNVDRLVEFITIGLEQEAKSMQILGYNYNSSEWFEQSYKILNQIILSKKRIEKILMKRVILKR